MTRATAGARQDFIVGKVWLTYSLFYLGRVNLSVALPFLAAALDISRAEAGALGTVFYWVYGISHFFSGQAGSRFSPFRMVGGGLLLIALVNIAFSFQTSLLLMLALWGINGIAQSGGWTPMLRILAENLDRSRIKRVSTVMPFSYVIGTVVTWTLVGAVATADNWRIAFWLPGVLTLGVLALWLRFGIDAPKAKPTAFRLSHVLREIRSVWFALAAAAMAGFVFNGGLIWLPTYILDSGLIAESQVGFVSALLQLLALVGLFLARFMVARSDMALGTASLLLLATAGAFLMVTLAQGWPALFIVALGLVTLNGAFGLVVGAMPMLLAPPGRTASITGSVNMMSNFFGGMAGFSIGAMVDASGWGGVFAVWTAVLLLASTLLWRFRRAEKI